MELIDKWFDDYENNKYTNFNKLIYLTNFYSTCSQRPTGDENQVVPSRSINTHTLEQKINAISNKGSMLNITGLCYLNGFIFLQNYEKANELFQQAIEKNNVNAITNSALMHKKGLGIPQNNEIAIKLLQQAASLCDPDALYHLATFYKIEQDYVMVIKLYQQAVNLGHPDAMYKLAKLYKAGEGTSQDFNKAIELYQQAENLDHQKAILDLALIYKLQKKFDMVVKLYQKAINLENTDAMCELAYMYQTGECIPQNYNKTIELYQKAASLDNTIALCALGKIYEQGIIVPKDYNKAIKQYTKAIILDDNNATEYLRDLLLSDTKLHSDYIKMTTNKRTVLERKYGELDKKYTDKKYKSN